jgi:hypothetical protein
MTGTADYVALGVADSRPGLTRDHGCFTLSRSCKDALFVFVQPTKSGGKKSGHAFGKDADRVRALQGTVSSNYSIECTIVYRLPRHPEETKKKKQKQK